MQIQTQFLRGIEDVIPPKSSLVQELIDVLEISADSAYRRIRGKTLLSIEEVAKLCEHFHISFDAFSKVKTRTVTFSFLPLEPTAESLAMYLESFHREMNNLASSKEPSLTFVCQDIPFFHHFNYPELANFMVFYWMRTILNLPDLSKLKFDGELQFPELIDIGKGLYDLYLKIPSTEVWSESTVRSTLRQISFYWESGIFDSKEVALRVCSALSKEVEDLERMAEIGLKQLESEQEDEESEEKPTTEVTKQQAGSYKLYISDIEPYNNCILYSTGDIQGVSLGHFTFSSMSTHSNTYCKKTELWMNNIIRKSTLLSGTSEKQRFQFFHRINRMIDDFMKRVNEDSF